MRRSVRTAFVVSAALVVSAACGSSSILEHVLSVRISATPSSAPAGDTVVFTFDITGPILVGVILAYGDGARDSVTTNGVTAASGRFTHAFETEGTFLVEGTVVDAREGRLTDSVTVQITP